MKYIVPFVLILSFNLERLAAQQTFTDTVSVFAYNINNYGFSPSGSCPLEGSPLKKGYIRTILEYENAPDIVSFEKYAAKPTNLASDSMQKQIMDSVCAGCYANTKYTNVSGYGKVNTLFYNKNKFGYLGTATIYSADNSISDIDLHKLYYLKFPSKGDTIFLNVIVVHDASGGSGAAQRATEIGGAMSWLSANVKTPGNYIFMGDFNVQSSSEACFQAMINPADTTVQFNEPTNQLGNWSSNPQAFANYLTQSTRSTDPGDCASTNTMSSWFDHILCTNPIMRGSKNVHYIPNSFKVIGQDGLHTNLGLTDAPTNTSVPANVLNALYMNSEHLPVQLKLQISSANPLPIGFDYFTIKLKNNQPYLQWQNNNNAAASGYEIERSNDGTDFTAINTIEAKNNTGAYNYIDAAVVSNNVIYYRIKEVLKAGGYLYSNVSSVGLNNTLNHIVIAPNPVKDRMNVSIESNVAGLATIHVINTLGQNIITQKAQLQAGNNSIAINNITTLTKGVYIIKVERENGMESRIFIKE